MGPNWNRTRGTGWNAFIWVRIRSERSSKKIDWRASSALLSFSCAPVRQMSSAQFRALVPNVTGLVEAQDKRASLSYI